MRAAIDNCSLLIAFFVVLLPAICLGQAGPGNTNAIDMTNAQITLFSATDFRGDSLVLRYSDRHMQQYRSLELIDGFNDRTSSIKAEIPAGFGARFYFETNQSGVFFDIVGTDSTHQLANLSEIYSATGSKLSLNDAISSIAWIQYSPNMRQQSVSYISPPSFESYNTTTGVLLFSEKHFQGEQLLISSSQGDIDLTKASNWDHHPASLKLLNLAGITLYSEADFTGKSAYLSDDCIDITNCLQSDSVNQVLGIRFGNEHFEDIEVLERLTPQ